MSEDKLMQSRVPRWVKDWWVAKAKELGCTYRGRTVVARLMVDIAAGKYAIVKVAPEKNS